MSEYKEETFSSFLFGSRMGKSVNKLVGMQILTVCWFNLGLDIGDFSLTKNMVKRWELNRFKIW